jgi:hypothetical protein
MRGVVVAIAQASERDSAARQEDARSMTKGRASLSHRSAGRPKARLRGEKSLAFDDGIIGCPIRACKPFLH